jgi:hypothetical protein
VDSSKINGKLSIDENKNIVVSLEVEDLSSASSVSKFSFKDASETEVVAIVQIISKTHVVQRKPSLVIEYIGSIISLLSESDWDVVRSHTDSRGVSVPFVDGSGTCDGMVISTAINWEIVGI